MSFIPLGEKCSEVLGVDSWASLTLRIRDVQLLTSQPEGRTPARTPQRFSLPSSLVTQGTDSEPDLWFGVPGSCPPGAQQGSGVYSFRVLAWSLVPALLVGWLDSLVTFVHDFGGSQKSGLCGWQLAEDVVGSVKNLYAVQRAHSFIGARGSCICAWLKRRMSCSFSWSSKLSTWVRRYTRVSVSGPCLLSSRSDYLISSKRSVWVGLGRSEP